MRTETRMPRLSDEEIDERLAGAARVAYDALTGQTLCYARRVCR